MKKAILAMSSTLPGLLPPARAQNHRPSGSTVRFEGYLIEI